MPSHLIVEPLAEDILTLVHCMVIDALSFPAPGFVAARDLPRVGFRGWVCRSTDDPTPWGFLGSQRTRDGLHVTAVATTPEQRRRGVAAVLMRTALLQAQRSRVPRVYLEVRPDNAPAIALYQKLGFTAGDRLPGYYGPDDDALSMSLNITQPKTRLRTRS